MAFENSTIVRAINPAFKVLEAVAPRAGSVIAERMWCTVPRARRTRTAEPGRVTRLNGLAVETWGEGPLVYLMHGWGGWRNQLDPFVAPLVAQGFQVVALDAPSHGDSDPGAFGRRRGLLPEFYTALRETVEHLGKASAVVAHSLGATATALAVLDGLQVDRLALIAPMADPIPYTKEFARWLGFGERIRTGFLDRIETRIGRRMSDFNVVGRAARATDLPPALVMHDEADRDVHYADGAAIAAAWPGAELHSTVGLGHRRILRDPAVVEAVVNYLSMASTATPSVARLAMATSPSANTAIPGEP